MNSDAIISAEGLGKKYSLRHQRGERYTALRDILTEKTKSFFRLNGFELSSLNNQPSTEDFWALKEVTFEVKEGEVLGVIGRNGAGKSTLLKILSRITEPSAGKVKIRGRVASLLEVGTGFHPELTGRENIYLNGAILGMTRKEIRAKFDEIVTFAEVERFLDTPVKRFSSGMYVRLAFAVAAHLEPEILVVDEVLAVGDAEFQKKCLGKMKDVSRSGRTVLFVSHNMNAVEQLCTRVLVLKGGRLANTRTDVRSNITAYMFASESRTENSIWTNCNNEFKNPWFVPRRFAVVHKDGSVVSGAQRNDQEIFLQIEAQIGELDASLTIGYCIYDENGYQLYWSYHTDRHPTEWPALKPGVCILRSQLPPRLLNEGTYRVELIGGLHFRQWLFEPNRKCPSVFITIHGGLSESPLWMQRRPGILAPVLSWFSE